MTFYVVDWAPEMAALLMEGIARAQESEGFSTPMPPITLIGVQGLWSPGLLVEIEAAAVLT
jgi:enamine deaminase RidA (YjgF/YER057c/UK114 family)